MKTNTTNILIVLLQILVVLLGLAVLVFLLWEPQGEGVNVGRTFFQIYFTDPFLAYVYVSSIAFFAALFQAFKVLGYVRADRAFSQESAKRLAIIKYCLRTLVGLILGAMIFLFIFNRGQDDITGGVFMGLLAIVVTGGIAVIAERFQKKIYGNNN